MTGARSAGSRAEGTFGGTGPYAAGMADAPKTRPTDDSVLEFLHSVEPARRREQGLELLTGLPAGGMGLPGRFRVGSLYARVADRTQRLHHHAIARAEAPEA